MAPRLSGPKDRLDGGVVAEPFMSPFVDVAAGDDLEIRSGEDVVEASPLSLGSAAGDPRGLRHIRVDGAEHVWHPTVFRQPLEYAAFAPVPFLWVPGTFRRE